MSRRALAVFAVLFCLAFPGGVFGALSGMLLQGRLVDNSTKEPRDGTFQMTFRIYEAPTGGTALYEEGSVSVTVENGSFSVMIGQSVPVPPEVFSGGERYLGITVAPDAEMTPRERLAASPYAYSSAALASDGPTRVVSGALTSTFTATGDLRVPYGVEAGSCTLSATGDAQFSLTASSGIRVQSGTLSVAQAVVAGAFVGDGSALSNVAPAAGSVTSAKIADGAVTSAKLGASAGMALLGSTELGSAAASLSLTFPARDNLVVFVYAPGLSAADQQLLVGFNQDSGTNYAVSRLTGTTETTATGQTSVALSAAALGSGPHRVAIRLPGAADAAAEKAGTYQLVYSAGSGTAPTQVNGAFAWGNTSSALTRVDLLLSGSGTLNAGTSVAVYGSDAP